MWTLALAIQTTLHTLQLCKRSSHIKWSHDFHSWSKDTIDAKAQLYTTTESYLNKYELLQAITPS